MRILIVDDSKVMRSIVARTLRQAGFDGHEISEAPNGRAALESIGRAAPDLVLTDWNMPEMAGIDLLRAVRKQGKKMPVVFVTSEGTRDMRELALDEGAQGLIAKPFTAEAFRNSLNRFFSR